MNLIKAKTAISTFLSKFTEHCSNEIYLDHHELQQFPTLSELETTIPDVLQIYCAHLNELQRHVSVI